MKIRNSIAPEHNIETLVIEYYNDIIAYMQDTNLSEDEYWKKVEEADKSLQKGLANIIRYIIGFYRFPDIKQRAIKMGIISDVNNTIDKS